MDPTTPQAPEKSHHLRIEGTWSGSRRPILANWPVGIDTGATW